MNIMKFRDPVKGTRVNVLVTQSMGCHQSGLKVFPAEADLIAKHEGLVRANRKSRGKGRKARVG